MKKIFLMSLFLLFAGVYGKNPPITRWIDPLGGEPITPEEYRAKFGIPQSPLKIGEVQMSHWTDDNLVDVVVNSAIYYQIEDEISRYIADLETDGYSVRLDTMSSGTADDLREHFISLRPELVGAVLVGNLPVKWYRMVEFLSDDPTDTTIEIFPCDYYLMELDGNWSDYDSDGVLDDHELYYNNEAEIFLGRIDPSRLTYGNPIELLQKYFDKNHSYRTGEMPIWNAVLSYEYKDWHPYFDYHFYEYEHADIMRDTLIFSAPDYLNRIRNLPYEMVSIMCHSSPWRHYMDPTLTFNNDLGLIPPNANFYQLFACSGARFVEQDNIATTYLFCGDRSLWVVGSSKTGSLYMIHTLPRFFEWLISKNIGETMRDILSDYGDWNPVWHYGLVLLGDPTLREVFVSRGTVPIDTVECTSEGFPLATDGSATDVKILSSPSTGINAYVLNGAISWHNNVEKFSFDGISFTDEGASVCYTTSSGELVVSDNPDYPFAASEGDPLAISKLGYEISYWTIERGEGYHSHPYILGTPSGGAVLYTHWSPGTPEPTCDLYLTFYHSSSWTPEAGYDYLIDDDANDKIYPCAVMDSTGGYWIFWTKNESDGAKIFGRYLSDGILGEKEVLGRGTISTAVVSGDGVVHLFWTDDDGALWTSYYREGFWSVAEQIYGERKVLRPIAKLDNFGEPFVLAPVEYPGLNKEIHLFYSDDSEWQSSRLTYNSASDFNPDGLVLDDGRLLLVWINGCSGDMSARWNIFDFSKIAESKSIMPQNSISVNPSPFNDVLNIQWKPVRYRKLHIYNIAGKSVAELDGIGKTRWDARNYPSGIYFVEIPEIGTKRVIHIQ